MSSNPRRFWGTHPAQTSGRYLDEPGEWFLHRNGSLLYLPLAGEEPQLIAGTLDVVADDKLEATRIAA